MRTKIVTAVLAGTVVLTGGALLVPGVAAAANPAVGQSRVSAVAEALRGLVSDGTLTQSQADRVASTLDEQLPHRGGRGRHGGRAERHSARLDPAVVAKATGATEAELRTALREGQTLAQVAESNGITKTDLIADLVQAAKSHLAEKVAEGDLTQAEADQKTARLPERIAARVDRARADKGLRRHGEQD